MSGKDKVFIPEWGNKEKELSVTAAGDNNSPEFRLGLLAGLSRGGNYIANRDVNPTSVTFANGRRVFLNTDGFLDVEYVWEPSI